MAVLEPRLAILDETDSGLDIDALKIVVERRQRAPQPGPRDHRRHALPAAAQLHRAGLRARAHRRPHRPIGRQGARARARGEGLRLGRCRDGGSEGLVMTAVAERHETLRRRSSRRSAATRRSAPSALRAIARGRVSTDFSIAGFPIDARRRVAVHERRADRRDGVRSARRAARSIAHGDRAVSVCGRRRAAIVRRQRPAVEGAVVARRAAGGRHGARPATAELVDAVAHAPARTRSSTSTTRSSRTASCIDVAPKTVVAEPLHVLVVTVAGAAAGARRRRGSSLHVGEASQVYDHRELRGRRRRRARSRTP